MGDMMASELTARARLGQWVRAQVRDKAEVELPDLVEAAVSAVQADKAWTRDFLHDGLQPLIYDLAQRVMATGRAPGDIIRTGDRLISKADFEEEARKQPRWANWYEHLAGRYIRLLDMRQADLLAAAQVRQEQAKPYLERAAFLKALAVKLPDAQCTVGEAFSEAEIEAVRQTLGQEKGAAANGR